MSFLKRLFGGGDPIDSLRRSVQQQRWAEALTVGENIDAGSLDEAGQSELADLLASAGDGLAAFNLSEGEACLRANDPERAVEHLQLAAGQASSDDLKSRIDEVRNRLQAPSPQEGAPKQAASSCCSTGCSSTADTAGEALPGGDLDMQTQLELILATYPKELEERYASSGEIFKKAFLLAHADEGEQALEMLAQLPEGERDDLFHFERGSLLARLGEPAEAVADLERAVAINPDLLLALDALVRLELSMDRGEQVERRLQQMLAQGLSAPFCCARLAELAVSRGDFEAALPLVQQALEGGSQEPETLLLASTLLEREGRLPEAEALLSRLGGGGCSGGGNIHQAEFWLRHSKNLDKALEAFKSAARQDQDQPRWRLRMAQTYLARGWKKEGVPMLRQVLEDERLEESLRQEGKALLDTLS